MHEIITLQFGQQANFLGTHYWNAQESYFTYDAQAESPVDHDRSFRQGVGADGSDTYTPRVLIYDLKGAFGTLRRENELYQAQDQQNPASHNAWGHDAFTIRLPPIAESPYQQALNSGAEPPVLTTETVRFWSDYNHVFFHPRSLIQLNEYELNSSLMPFELYDTGDDLFASLDREHDLLDRDLRPQLEECDQLQGIQVFSSTTDAWGGFASKYLERMSDELGKGSRWLFGLEANNTVPRTAAMLRLANLARVTTATSETVSLHVPLQTTPTNLPGYIQLDPRSTWHTSALQMAIVESLTLPARLKQDDAQHATFNEMEAVLNTDGRRPISAASLEFATLTEKSAAGSTTDSRMTNGLVHDKVSTKDEPYAVDAFPRDLPASSSSRMSSAPASRAFASYKLSRDAHFDEADDDDHEDYQTKRLERKTTLLFPRPKSYPKIISLGSQADDLAVKVSLVSSERVSHRLRYLAHLTRAVLPVDGREALYDNLSTMAEEYEESMGFSDLSEEDDD